MHTSIDILSKQADQLRSEASPLIKKTINPQSTLSQGYAHVKDFAGLAKDAASNASDSVVAFTKKNPLAALAIAAASDLRCRSRGCE
jgi:hypothetical protein